MSKNTTIQVQDTSVSVTKTKNDEDYICLTDMIKAKEGSFFITDWLRNRNTLEFLATWENLNNPNFNYGEFAIIAKDAGLNSFKISVKEWVKRTNAIGVFSKAGKYGGTYAHEDIATHFASWISPNFQLYLIQEFKRLKKAEAHQLNKEWDQKRILSKVNYELHTDAVKEHVIPNTNINKDKEYLVYAKEADLYNYAVFGCTAKQWRDKNPKYAKEGWNVRDFASINELNVIANLEYLNSRMIRQGASFDERLEEICTEANRILNQLNAKNRLKARKKESIYTYPETEQKQKTFKENMEQVAQAPKPEENRRGNKNKGKD